LSNGVVTVPSCGAAGDDDAKTLIRRANTRRDRTAAVQHESRWRAPQNRAPDWLGAASLFL
jgi:hypothetical protein